MSKATKVAVAAALALCAATCRCGNTSLTLQAPENAGRFKCEKGAAYIITDTKTNVQYLAWDMATSPGGGVCVLVDRDGKPMLAGDAE